MRNIQMMNERAAIGIGARTAIDQRRLLLVLGRAIDEEVAAAMGGDRSTTPSERDRVRLMFLCTLTGRIRDMNASETAGAQVHPGRRESSPL
jgi:hypothetical protein